MYIEWIFIAETIINFFTGETPRKLIDPLKLTIINFFTGVTIRGMYRDDLSFVATNYLEGRFFFDALTCVPASTIEIIIDEGCDGGQPVSGISRYLLIFRVLRIARLVKVFRLLDSPAIRKSVAHFDTYFRPPVIVMRMLRILVWVGFVVHTCLCSYWLVKAASNHDYEIEDFLLRNNLDADAGLFDRYVLACYFVNTVCIYIYIFMYLYIYIFIHIYIYVYIYICIYN